MPLKYGCLIAKSGLCPTPLGFAKLIVTDTSLHLYSRAQLLF